MINQTTLVYNCNQPGATLYVAILLIIFAMPFHLILMKIFYTDCQLALPHHKVMMSLTSSDALQIFTLSAWVICKKILSTTKLQEAACKFLETIVLFFTMVTLIVSSLSIVTLSIERYVSCIYSLYLYHVMTTKRVIFLLIAQWLFAMGLGATTVYLHESAEKSATSLTESSITRRVSLLVIFPSATVIALIQLRLLHFSHSKLALVKPYGAYGTKAETVDFRKRQVKITFVASIVAVAYIGCMFPIAILQAYEWRHGSIDGQLLKSVLIALAMLNTLVDPLIYGLGVKDTRKLMWKNIKKVKDFILWHLCRVS